VRSPQGRLLSAQVNPADGASRRVGSATLEANTHWAERAWSLVYGARLDEYSDFGRHTSPRLGLVYHPRADSAVKLLYGQAFRAPSAVEIGGAQNSVLGNPALKPEIIDSYELIGMRETANMLATLTLYRRAQRCARPHGKPPVPWRRLAGRPVGCVCAQP
jgi:outer membrane cobalamin receptor